MSENEKLSGVQEKPKNKILDAITTGFDWIYRILLEYSKLVLLVIVVIVTAQVFSRKVLNSSIRWSEEVTLVLMVWMAFISMAIGVEKNLHICIEMFFKHFPKVVQNVLNFINNLLVLLVGGVLLVYGVKLIQYTSTSTLPATQWPACTLYLMMPVGGFFIVYFSLLRLLGLERYRHLNIEEGGNQDV